MRGRGFGEGRSDAPTDDSAHICAATEDPKDIPEEIFTVEENTLAGKAGVSSDLRFASLRGEGLPHAASTKLPESLFGPKAWRT
jgi:hypothetical protein